MASNPAISIIMPIYNSELYLAQSIHSVLNQSFTDWELICVNDASTDQSPEILKDYEQKDERIHVFAKTRNSGNASAVRNVALEYVKGAYIHCLDSDDYISSDFLENAYRKAVETGADIVCPDVCQFSDTRYFNMKAGLFGDRSATLTPKEAFFYSLGWGISFRSLWKSDIVKSHQFNFNYMYGDEYSIKKFILEANKIVFSTGVYYYRENLDSLTNKVSIKVYDRLDLNNDIRKLILQKSMDKKVLDKHTFESIKDFLNLILLTTKNLFFFSKAEKNKILEKINIFYKSIPDSERESSLNKLSGYRWNLKRLHANLFLSALKTFKN